MNDGANVRTYVLCTQADYAISIYNIICKMYEWRQYLPWSGVWQSHNAVWLYHQRACPRPRPLAAVVLLVVIGAELPAVVGAADQVSPAPGVPIMLTWNGESEMSVMSVTTAMLPPPSPRPSQSPSPSPQGLVGVQQRRSPKLRPAHLWPRINKSW